MKKLSVLTGILLFSMLMPAFAQEEKVSVQQRGNHYIALDVNFNRGDIGYWIKMSDQTDVGLNIGLFFRDSEHLKDQQYIFTPAIKHYLLSDKSYAPYLYSGIFVSYGKFNNDHNFNSENYRIGALGGIGLEWFPMQKISIGGHVGIQAQYEAQRNFFSTVTSTTTGTTTITGTSSDSFKEEGYSVNTFNSGIRLNLFF